MNAIKFTVVVVLTLLGNSFAQTAPTVAEAAVSQWGNMTETSCGRIFQCITAEDMKTLSGKTLKYRHLRFQDFGYVYLVLKEGGKAESKNDKGHASGSWELKDNLISFKMNNSWGDFSFLFYKIGDQLFAAPKTLTGGGWFVPVAVVSD